METAFADLAFDDAFGAVWQLIRDANAYIEEQQPWATHKAGDAAATAAVLGDCLEALRIVALLASPVIPRAAAELWQRLGLARRTGGRTRVPDDARLGRGRRTVGNALEKGPSLFPRSRREPSEPSPRAGPCGWVDSHCHLPEDPAEADAVVDAARAEGVEWLVCVGTDLATSRAAVAVAEPTAGRAPRPSASTRTTRSGSTTSGPSSTGSPGPRASWRSGSAASTTTTSTRRARTRPRPSGPRSASPTSSTGRS